MPNPDNPTMDERWIWAVQYRDGSFLEEYPDPETHNSFAALVDIDRVRELDIIPNHWLGLDGSIFVVPIRENMRPIFFRQNAFTIGPVRGEKLSHVRYTVFGYQYTRAGQNVQHLTYLPESDPSAAIVLTPYRLEIG